MQYKSGLLYLLNYEDISVLIYGANDLNIGLVYSYAANAGLANLMDEKEDDTQETTDLTSDSSAKSTIDLTDEGFKEMA